MRDAGMSAADIAREAAELHSRSHASFVLDTMEFLAAGGRCPTLVAYWAASSAAGRASSWTTRGGAMKVGKLYRGKPGESARALRERHSARYPDIGKDEIFITHSG